jgi:hypothetical protein
VNDTFFTLTDIDTKHTNSRSRRYPTVDAAVEAARQRIALRESEGVAILQCVGFVHQGASFKPRLRKFRFTFWTYSPYGDRWRHEQEDVIEAENRVHAMHLFEARHQEPFETCQEV